MHCETNDKGNDNTNTYLFSRQVNEILANIQKSSFKMQKKTIKCIVVPRGTVDEIMREVGCSQMTVYRALRMESASEQADKIRKLALAKGGSLTTKAIFKPIIAV